MGSARMCSKPAPSGRAVVAWPRVIGDPRMPIELERSGRKQSYNSGLVDESLNAYWFKSLAIAACLSTSPIKCRSLMSKLAADRVDFGRPLLLPAVGHAVGDEAHTPHFVYLRSAVAAQSAMHGSTPNTASTSAWGSTLELPSDHASTRRWPNHSRCRWARVWMSAPQPAPRAPNGAYR